MNNHIQLKLMCMFQTLFFFFINYKHLNTGLPAKNIFCADNSATVPPNYNPTTWHKRTVKVSIQLVEK